MNQLKEYAQQLIAMPGLDEVTIGTVKELAMMLLRARNDGAQEILDTNIAAGHEKYTVRDAIQGGVSEGPF
jgi:hypothetical protein